MRLLISSIILFIGAVACSSATDNKPATDATKNAPNSHQSPSESSAMTFNKDSAYKYVADQVAFGPRVPGSPAHKACAKYLIDRLSGYGVNVETQRTDLTDISGNTFEMINIIGHINPEASKRILLLAHWDSRPWADNDPDPANHKTPIDGANDGASGVAVILEVARQLQLSSLDNLGVDILLTDAEDSGLSAPEDATPDQVQQYENSWCLGTQHWIKSNPWRDTPRPQFAILLDMVGGRDATFPIEYFSYQYTPDIVNLVLEASRKAGTTDRFPTQIGGAINDDHIHLNSAGIPTVDIIQTSHSGFNPTWHTIQDNLSNIDRATLAAVGHTILTLLLQQQ